MTREWINDTMCAVPPGWRKRQQNSNTAKGRNTTMGIAYTSRNGKTVSLTASYDLESCKAVYTVRGPVETVEFADFGEAAKLYNKVSAEIEAGKEVA